MEKRAKYAKIHPEMSNLDLTKILSKKYKELPEKKKVGTLNEHLTGFFFYYNFFLVLFKKKFLFCVV